MKEKLIKAYINNLTMDDLVKYANKYNVKYNKKELEYVYTTIKNKYDVFISNPNYILNEAKNNLSEENYKLLYELYTTYYHQLYH